LYLRWRYKELRFKSTPYAGGTDAADPYSKNVTLGLLYMVS